MKLTKAQQLLLSAASRCRNGALELPGHLKGGGARKVVAKLLTEGLIEEIRARGSLPVCKRGRSLVEVEDVPDANQKAEEQKDSRTEFGPSGGKSAASNVARRKPTTETPRINSKQATVIAMLRG